LDILHRTAPCRNVPVTFTLAFVMSGTFHSKVVGVTAKNSDGSSRQKYIGAYCRSGMSAALVREPNNQYDPNAVGVWVKARAFIFFTANLQIGYLSSDVASEVAPLLDSGHPVACQIAEVTGGVRGKNSYGVNILLSKG
jgi:hypothetical protein